MFFSYAFLHAGPVHLIGNMLAIGGLVRMTMERISARGFVMLYLVSLLGGAIAFGILATSPAPMVGASGRFSGRSWLCRPAQTAMTRGRRLSAN